MTLFMGLQKIAKPRVGTSSGKLFFPKIDIYNLIQIYNSSTQEYITNDAEFEYALNNYKSYYIYFIYGGLLNEYQTTQSEESFQKLNEINRLYIDKLKNFGKLSSSIYICATDDVSHLDSDINYSIYLRENTINSDINDDAMYTIINFTPITDTNVKKIQIKGNSDDDKTLYKYQPYTITSSDLSSSGFSDFNIAPCFTYLGCSINGDSELKTESYILSQTFTDSVIIEKKYSYPTTYTVETSITATTFKEYGTSGDTCYGAKRFYNKTSGSINNPEIKIFNKRPRTSDYCIDMEWSSTTSRTYEDYWNSYVQPSTNPYKYCDIYINNVLKYTKTLPASYRRLMIDDISYFKNTDTAKMSFYNAIPSSGTYTVKFIFRQS